MADPDNHLTGEDLTYWLIANYNAWGTVANDFTMRLQRPTEKGMDWLYVGSGDKYGCYYMPDMSPQPPAPEQIIAEIIEGGSRTPFKLEEGMALDGWKMDLGYDVYMPIPTGYRLSADGNILANDTKMLDYYESPETGLRYQVFSDANGAATVAFSATEPLRAGLFDDLDDDWELFEERIKEELGVRDGFLDLRGLEERIRSATHNLIESIPFSDQFPAWWSQEIYNVGRQSPLLDDGIVLGDGIIEALTVMHAMRQQHENVRYTGHSLGAAITEIGLGVESLGVLKNVISSTVALSLDQQAALQQITEHESEMQEEMLRYLGDEQYYRPMRQAHYEMEGLFALRGGEAINQFMRQNIQERSRLLNELISQLPEDEKNRVQMVFTAQLPYSVALETPGSRYTLEYLGIGANYPEVWSLLQNGFNQRLQVVNVRDSLLDYLPWRQPSLREPQWMDVSEGDYTPMVLHTFIGLALGEMELPLSAEIQLAEGGSDSAEPGTLVPSQPAGPATAPAVPQNDSMQETLTRHWQGLQQRRADIQDIAKQLHASAIEYIDWVQGSLPPYCDAPMTPAVKLLRAIQPDH